jgi:AAA ATPase domain
MTQSEHVFAEYPPVRTASSPARLGSILSGLRACGGTGRRARLRALWSVWTVGVRISLGASESPANAAFSGVSLHLSLVGATAAAERLDTRADACLNRRVSGSKLLGRTRGLVGREDELQAITRLLDGVRDRGRALIVRGDAGIGKTALLAAARTTATNNSMIVMSCPLASGSANVATLTPSAR